MADYHPLIARAVGGLEKDTAENRRALYGRARTALVAQLRGTEPPLDEPVITRERLALEEAIRKVEVESARRAREAPRPEPLAGKRAAQTARHEETAQPVVGARPLSEETATIAIVPPASKSARDRPVAPSEAPAGLWPQSEHAAFLDEALKEIREIAGDPNRQGAPARAERFARPMRPTSLPAAPVSETSVANSAVPEVPVPPPAISAVPVSPPARQPPYQTPPLQPLAPLSAFPPPGDPLQELESLLPRLPQENWQTPPAEQVRPLPDFDVDDLGARISPQKSFRPEDEQTHVPRALRSYRRPTWMLAGLLAVTGAGVLGYWQGSAIMQTVRDIVPSFRGPATQAQKSTAPSQQKNIDRIGQPAAPESSTSTLPVAQRAMLTTEPDAGNPRGRDYVGSANWRLETIPAGPGRAAEVAIKLEVEIPDRGFAMSWLIRRNTDAALPASHTIDIEINMAPNSPLGKIVEIRSLLMKQPGQLEGSPLWGHAQKSTANYFLVGLSAVDADSKYNMKLLKEQPAFDIALVFSNVRRAFLLIEKGAAGERVFAEAFAAWKQ